MAAGMPQSTLASGRGGPAKPRRPPAAYRRIPLTIASTAHSGPGPRATSVSSSFRSTLPIAASGVTSASLTSR